MNLYLNILSKNGEVIEDIEGASFTDLEAAIQEAIWSARELMASSLLAGMPDKYQAIIITDEDGKELTRVSFNEAVPA